MVVYPNFIGAYLSQQDAGTGRGPEPLRVVICGRIQSFGQRVLERKLKPCRTWLLVLVLLPQAPPMSKFWVSLPFFGIGFGPSRRGLAPGVPAGTLCTTARRLPRRPEVISIFLEGVYICPIYSCRRTSCPPMARSRCDWCAPTPAEREQRTKAERQSAKYFIRYLLTVELVSRSYPLRVPPLSNTPQLRN